MGVRGVFVIVLLLIAAMVAGAASCQSPTQVTLVITTKAKCQDMKGVDIVVGVEPNETEGRASTRYSSTNTSACTPTPSGGDIGTLVVTPGGERGTVIVIAGFLANVTTCEPPLYKGCIVARRSFSFVDGTPLTLPIAIDPDCVDVPCNAVSTCAERKQCVSSEVRCDESGACSSPGVTEDGGIVIVDATLSDVPPNDAGADGPNAQDAATDAPVVDAPYDGPPLTPIPEGGIPYGECPNPTFCPNGFTQCFGPDACCFPSPGAVANCFDQLTCEQMQDESMCCKKKDDCPHQEECCVKLGPTGNMHIACAVMIECAGDHPPALVCQTPGSMDAGECGPGRTCTNVAVGYGVYRCSN